MFLKNDISIFISVYAYIYIYSIYNIYIINKMSTLGTTKKFQHV